MSESSLIYFTYSPGGRDSSPGSAPSNNSLPSPPTLHFILLVLYLFGLEHRIVLHSDPQVLQRSNDPRLVYHIPGHFVHELLKVDLVIEDFFDPAFSFFEFLVFHGKLFRSYQPSDTPNKVAQYVPFCAAGQSEVSGVLQLPNGWGVFVWNPIGQKRLQRSVGPIIIILFMCLTQRCPGLRTAGVLNFVFQQFPRRKRQFCVC